MKFRHPYVLLILQLHSFAKVNSECPAGYTVHPYYSNKCYHASPTRLKGSDYESYCASKSGLRASIHNNAIYLYVNTLTTNSYMIGLSWTLSPKVYSWADGREFVHWPGVPTKDPQTKDDISFILKPNNEWKFETNSRLLIAICDVTLENGAETLLNLVGGTAMCGRVEVFHEGLWGTIYDTNPDPSLGVFVCDYFGYDFLTFATSCVSTPGTGKIWLQSVSCQPSATTIDNCIAESSSWGTTETDHSFDVHVQCGVKSVILPTPSTTNPFMSTIIETVTETTTINITITETLQVTDTHVLTATPLAVTLTVTETLSTSSKMENGYCLTNCSERVNGTLFFSSTAFISSTTVVSLQGLSTANSTGLLNFPKYDKRTSAMYSTATIYDMRPSAIVIGTSGVIILVGLVGFIVVTDLLYIITSALSKQKNVYLKQKRTKTKKKRKTNFADYALYAEDLTTRTSPKLNDTDSTKFAFIEKDAVNK